jgi:hypothetical protein
LADPLPHPDDANKEAEHEAAMALVTPASATLYVPAGQTRELGGDLTHVGVRVEDGSTLRLLPGCVLRAETVIGTPQARLEVITDGPPITIIGRDTGPMDPAADPYLLGRGIVWHGSVSMVGPAVTPWVEMADAPAGARSVRLSALVTGWRVGDTLLIPGQEYGQDEVRTLVDFDGQTAHLADPPLAYPHTFIVADGELIPPVVANLSRRVTVRSENPALDRRWHVMWMHTDRVSVENVAFKDGGRTDKSRPFTRPVPGVPASLLNVVGRYGVHWHLPPCDKARPPATMRGCSVWGSPGWGVVNHGGNVVVEDHVSFDVFGAHLATELGGEIGAFRRFLCVKSTGAFDTPDASHGRREPGDPNKVLGDFGTRGHAVWGQGQGVVVEDGLACGHPGGAYVVSGVGSDTFRIANLPDPSLVDGIEQITPPGTMPAQDVPGVFRRLKSWASPVGFECWGLHNFPFHRRQDTRVEDCVFHRGRLFIGYSGHLYFRNVVVWGNPDDPRGEGYGHTDLNYAITFENCRIKGWETGARMPTDDFPNGLPGPASRVTGGDFGLNVIGFVHRQPQPGRQRTLHYDGTTAFPRLPAAVLAGRESIDYCGRLDMFQFPRYYFELARLADRVDVFFAYFDAPAPAMAPADEVKVGDRFLCYAEQAADFDVSGWAALPHWLRFKADGTPHTIGSWWTDCRLAFGGRVPLTDFERRPGVVGVLSARPADLLPRSRSSARGPRPTPTTRSAPRTRPAW